MCIAWPTETRHMQEYIYDIALYMYNTTCVYWPFVEAQMGLRINICTYMYNLIHVHVYICTCVLCLHVCTCICVHVCIICIHIHVTYMHVQVLDFVGPARMYSNTCMYMHLMPMLCRCFFQHVVRLFVGFL